MSLQSMRSSSTEDISPELALQRIYAQVSSEVPRAPEIFNLKEAPQVDIKFDIQYTKIPETSDLYTVELTVLVNATEQTTQPTAQAKTVFLIEVKQGGLFAISGVDEKNLELITRVHCPTLLYPYASALVADLVVRAGFMPLHLPLIDFNILYLQQQQTSVKKDLAE